MLTPPGSSRRCINLRDNYIAKELGFKLIVHVNEEGRAQGVNPFTHGSKVHTDIMKTQALRQGARYLSF